jgi:hypothetical protein
MPTPFLQGLCRSLDHDALPTHAGKQHGLYRIFVYTIPKRVN